jgi:hypothetical protein
MLRAPSRPRATAGPAAVTLATALTLMLLSGCSGAAPRATPSTAPPTPIGQLNTAQMELHRIPFCDLVPRQAVADALGGRATDRSSWRNGDTTSLVGGSGDRAQELGCRFSAGSSAAAAWVFASPVEPSFARQVVRDSSRQRSCRDEPGATFGQPSELQTCRLPGGIVRVRHAGLFGQTWLTCQVSAAAPDQQVTRRADAWCVQVANTLNTSR